MPELPEIEHLKRTLAPVLIGAKIKAVELRRRDIVHRHSAARVRRCAPRELLAGCAVADLVRHGKNLAIVSECGRALGVHLGMSGQMVYVPVGQRSRSDHVHCVWRIRSACGEGRLLFRDPRRFGGLWPFDSIALLRRDRFEPLGPDALTISSHHLRKALQRSRRAIKAALLDQSVLAGVGNIYADESLFRAGIHPASMACEISTDRVAALARSIRAVLRAAIAAGGSSIENYVDAHGVSGSFTLKLKAYGRGDEKCVRCAHQLAQTTIAQRTTVFCPCCQRHGR